MRVFGNISLFLFVTYFMNRSIARIGFQFVSYFVCLRALIRQVVSIKAKHGHRLRELPKVTVKLTTDTGAEDQEVFRKHVAPGLREVQICRMAEEALDQGGVLTQETNQLWQ